jgi:hypothetical protein
MVLLNVEKQMVILMLLNYVEHDINYLLIGKDLKVQMNI